ncbi:MAG TPA: DUF2339 domain-containing protein, partial [Burkholderiales bacterium]|nr:DUF2339 domain-containing protein [Burkholderiales bacterium]
MWFAGLLIGGLIGSLGGFTSGVFGALVGAIAGWVIGSAMKPAAPKNAPGASLADIEFMINHIYKSLEDIHWRLARLEKPGESAAPAAERAPEPMPAATATDNVGRHAAAAPAAAVSNSELEVPATTPSAIPGTSVAGVASMSAQVQPEVAAAIEPLPPSQSRQSPFAASAEKFAAPFVETGPSWLQRLFSGNIVAKVGAIVLFFGTCFLLKFAYDHTVVPVTLRLIGVALGGCAMVAGGWRLLGRRRLYGLILQGAGIGVLYIDVFFALKVYALIEPFASFALFMALGVVATLLAVRQDSRVLAALGLTGAFLAPVLAGSREGNHVLLFSYYTVLNGFILAISWFKAWRELNLVGFIFTFIVGVFWGAHNYRPELFDTVEPFVLIFFAMYLVIPILFATRQPPELKGLVDGTLVFGTPLSAAFMQAGLVRELPYGLAWSAGCAAALYALL